MPSDKAVFTLAGVQPASWWIRRMAHETAIHWLAERAAGLGPDGGPPAGFLPELAADGVEEVLDVMFPRRFDYSGFGATRPDRASPSPPTDGPRSPGSG